jgi:hypothetical protein
MVDTREHTSQLLRLSHPAVYQGWHLGEGVLYGMWGSVETGGREDRQPTRPGENSKVTRWGKRDSRAERRGDRQS